MASPDRARVVARVWGLPAALVASLALCTVVVLAGDVWVEVPLLRNQITLLHLVPALTGMALGFPLVDRTPDLTLLAVAPGRLPMLRLMAVVAVSSPVIVVLMAAGWTWAGASVVLGFVGFAALAAGMLRLAYWVPFFAVVVTWGQLRAPWEAAAAGPWWLVGSLGSLVAGGASYVAIGAWRVRRVVRGGDAKSGCGHGLDTIRP